MPMPYAVKSSRWVDNKDYSQFLLVLAEYAGSLSPETWFNSAAKKSYVTVEFMDVEDFNQFNQACYILFDTHSQEYTKQNLTWFQRVIKSLKNLI